MPARFPSDSLRCNSRNSTGCWHPVPKYSCGSQLAARVKRLAWVSGDHAGSHTIRSAFRIPCFPHVQRIQSASTCFGLRIWEWICLRIFYPSSYGRCDLFRADIAYHYQMALRRSVPTEAGKRVDIRPRVHSSSYSSCSRGSAVSRDLALQA